MSVAVSASPDWRRSPRVRRGHLVRLLIELGWTPPLPTPAITERILVDMSAPRTPAASTLTPQQTRILKLLANGASQPEIADYLGCSVETIRTYTADLRSRIGARTAAHAVAIAFTEGIISSDDIEGGGALLHQGKPPNDHE